MYWTVSVYQDDKQSGLCIDTFRSDKGSEVNGVIRILEKDRNGVTNKFVAHTLSPDMIDDIIKELQVVKQKIISNKQSMTDKDIELRSQYEKFWKQDDESSCKTLFDRYWNDLTSRFHF